jgi:hypothetical protein
MEDACIVQGGSRWSCDYGIDGTVRRKEEGVARNVKPSVPDVHNRRRKR